MNVYRTNTDDLTDSTLKLVAQMEIDGSGTAFAIDVEGSYTLDTGVPPFYSSNTFTEGYGLAFVVHCSAVNDVGTAGATTGFLNVEYTLY
jgi:hydrogenase maturation factor